MNSRTIIQDTTRLNRRFEDKYLPKIESVLKAEISSLIEVIKAYGIHEGVSHVSKMTTSKVANVVQSLYMEVGLQYARRQWKSLQEQKRAASKFFGPLELKGFGFNARWVQSVQDYLYRFLTEKILLDLSNHTKKTLLKVLNKSIESGWGIDKTVNELKDLDMPKKRAAKIVRTETTRAANTGQAAASDSFEYEQTKEWISATDRRTRGQHKHDHASHIGLNGTVIDYEETFTDPINGDKLRFPGDPNASAASTINCRCTLGIEAKIGPDGRLIPKKKKAVA